MRRYAGLAAQPTWTAISYHSLSSCFLSYDGFFLMQLPRFLRVRQLFPVSPELDIEYAVRNEVAKLVGRVSPSDRIAIGVGSRGISNLSQIVKHCIDSIQDLGAKPFIIPAMGSHGGATPAGQRELLATYGINEQSMGVPILDSLEVQSIGTNEDGVTAYCSTEALKADGIVLINRIKPHTDFSGTLGSGLLKMSVIGLGKQRGAAAMHLGAMQFGYERTIRSLAKVVIASTPILGGIAILENQRHQTAKLQAVVKDEMNGVENALLVEAKALMPTLPFDEIDLLVVDAIGKNISGAGMDPNVINRSIHGYDSNSARGDRAAPFIRRIFVRGLTEESHGNAIGIGMADAVSSHLMRQANMAITRINALTSLTPQSAKVPLTFDSELEAMECMLRSLPIADWGNSRVVRIANTLEISEMEISESLWSISRGLQQIGPIRLWQFADDGGLST